MKDLIERQPDLQPTCNQLATDAISRQAALNIRFSDAINEDGVLYVPLWDFIDGLMSLPSVQSKRKRSRWIVYYECPKCGEITKDFTEYCPFCNADMRSEEDE